MNESVDCPVCSATPGEPCVFAEPQPDGTRPVHAARYAMTLPESERAEFWDGAIDRWLRTNGIEGGSDGD